MSNVHPRPLRPAGAALAFTLGLAALFGGCQKGNPGFCGDSCPVDADVTDAVAGCLDNPELCTASESCVADVCVDCPVGNDHQSAECTDPAAPVCAPSLACRACAADSECDSSFCDGGLCIATDQVIYLAAGGTDTTTCSQAAPCGSPLVALSKVTVARKYMRVAPSGVAYTLEPDAPFTVNKDLVIHATGAILERPGGNQVVDVTQGTVVITGLTVRGAAGGANADGIKCNSASLTLRSAAVLDSDDRGIEAGNCVLDVSRSVIAGNRMGGVRLVDGSFSITNTFIYGNGTNGGLSLNPNATPNRLEFNTIVKNSANMVGGVNCLGTSSITARNNLIHGNTGTAETGGTSCTHSYSVIGIATPPAGTMVRSMTPAEVALVNGNGATVADFHIAAASLLRGAAEPGSATGPTAVDYDGEARPNPAGGAADIGADEIP